MRKKKIKKKISENERNKKRREKRVAYLSSDEILIDSISSGTFHDLLFVVGLGTDAETSPLLPVTDGSSYTPIRLGVEDMQKQDRPRPAVSMRH